MYKYLWVLALIIFSTKGFTQGVASQGVVSQGAASQGVVSTKAQSQVTINMGQARVQKSPLALTPLKYLGGGTSKSDRELGLSLDQVIRNDLRTSSYFTLIDPNAYLEDPHKVGLQPAPGERNGFNYANWSALGTHFLIRMGYRIRRNQVELSVYLYYVPQAKLKFTKRYRVSKDTQLLRKLAHTLASDIIEALTGKPGMFNSQIVCVSDHTGHKEIYVMDWDGFNLERLTKHKSITLSPAWSSDGKYIAYTAYAYHPKIKSKNVDLFIYDLQTKKVKMISYRKGLNSGASFLPQGEDLLLTIAKWGRSDIFRINRNGKILSRLTNGPNGAINVEAAVAPDGAKVLFSSNRSGRPMIYMMNIDGSEAKRITFAGKYNASPVWSPSGSKIAFAGYDKGHFDIFIMDANGKNLKRLTSAKTRSGRWADNEDPSFSPDGRHIVFSSNRTEKNQLFIMDVNGEKAMPITSDRYNYYKPRWSPVMN